MRPESEESLFSAREKGPAGGAPPHSAPGKMINMMMIRPPMRGQGEVRMRGTPGGFPKRRMRGNPGGPLVRGMRPRMPMGLGVPGIRGAIGGRKVIGRHVMGIRPSIPLGRDATGMQGEKQKEQEEEQEEEEEQREAGFGGTSRVHEGTCRRYEQGYEERRLAQSSHFYYQRKDERKSLGFVLQRGQGSSDVERQDTGGKHEDLPLHLQQCLRFYLHSNPRGHVRVGEISCPSFGQQDDH